MINLLYEWYFFSGGLRALKIKRRTEKAHLLPAYFQINHYFCNFRSAWKTGAYYFSSFSELALSISWESCYFSNLTTSRTFPAISKKLSPINDGKWCRVLLSPMTLCARKPKSCYFRRFLTNLGVGNFKDTCPKLRPESLYLDTYPIPCASIWCKYRLNSVVWQQFYVTWCL